MEYFVADSYKGYEIVETKEENDKMYAVIKIPCSRCGGTGRIPFYGHVDGGVCFKCKGTPFSFKEVRAYTAEEKAKLDERNAKAAATREAKKIADAPQKYEYFCKKNGFNKEENCTYIVIGDSYSVKDYLKESGCKYDKALGWHTPVRIDLPDSISLHKVMLEDIITVDKYGNVNYNYNIEDYIKEIKNEYTREMSDSEYYAGEIGDRIKEITVTVKKVRGFSGRFGWTNIYTFLYEDCELVWFTSTNKELEEGDVVGLTGTIKEFKEYNGVKQTVLTRCHIS